MACSRIISERNVKFLGRFGILDNGERMDCRVVEVVKYIMLRWFGHLERTGKNGITKYVHIYI